jgi:hypothetical protein
MNPQETQTINAQITLLRSLESWYETNMPGIYPQQIVQLTIDNLEDLVALPPASSYPLTALTGPIIRRIWRQNKITQAPIRQCGICEAWLTYEFDGAILIRDTSCDCNSLNSRSLASFDDILRDITMQSTDQKKVEIAKWYKIPVEEVEVI